MTIRILDQCADEITTPSKELQWPNLDVLTPGNIRRTFSTVMQDWEKSLSPSLDGTQRGSLDDAVGNEKGEADHSEATHEALMLSR